MKIFHKIISSPIGKLNLIADKKKLLAIKFIANTSRKAPELAANSAIVRKTEKQLIEYFKGSRKKFSIPIKFTSGTSFQQKIWRALISIPYGVTISYAELAKKIGRAKAFRAAGAACGKNPLAIIVPCHRVIGKNGSLTGFAGGITKKSLLLQLEQQKS